MSFEGNVIFNDRRSLYTETSGMKIHSNFDAVGKQLNRQYIMSTPIQTYMTAMSMFSDMQYSSFICIVIMLAFLRSIVVYSLMLFDAD